MRNKKLREKLKLLQAFESVCLRLPKKLSAELNKKEIDDEAMIFFLEIVKRYGTKKDKKIWGIETIENQKKVNAVEENSETEKIEDKEDNKNISSNSINENKEERKRKISLNKIRRRKRRL